ncbi:MAG TPA: hypothetical protein VHG28_13480 [Longimicrobiaceae bacterium]|nr:hypothetical protein [Longimicrobiaceae bacterium]
MSPRTRSAAFLALLALVLTWTGGAWAALCAMEETGYGSVAAAPAGHAHGHPDGHPAPAPSPDAGDEDRAPACPWMVPGGAGSCLGSFVGVEGSFQAMALRSDAHSFAPPRDARDLLLADRPFHPPEA